MDPVSAIQKPNFPSTDELVVMPITNRPQDMPLVESIVAPEFTCFCPWSGLPDFARITFQFIIRDNVIELKTFKLYLNSWRETGATHEQVIGELARVFKEFIDPHALHIEGAFNVRGGIFTRVYSGYNQEQLKPLLGDPYAVSNV